MLLPALIAVVAGLRVLSASGCYTDSDCERNQYCNGNGECDDNAVICYGDDECRGHQVCDMGSYICVDPTPSPTEAGCCKGSSYKAQAKCEGLMDEVGCERKDCQWVVTDDPKDCVITTTTTTTTSTTPEPGCCYGDTMASNEMCRGFDQDPDKCDARNNCEFRAGEDADCTITQTTTTEEAGCCKGSSLKNADMCAEKEGREQCERSSLCSFLVTDDPSDCEMTTTTEEQGCCQGDSAKSNPMCNKREGREQCEKSSSCHFVADGVLEEDCAYPSTTITPGCCYINPDAAYSRKYQETCIAFYTERDCLKLTNGDGEARCAWSDLVDGYDCSLLWPTTTTTTLPAGCCKGSSYRAQAKCFGLDSQVSCERKDCEWVETEDPSDCVITTTTTTTTTTTEEVGCCKGDSAKSNPMCNAREGRERCERSSSCHFVLTEDFSLCEYPPTTTSSPGCCYGNPDVSYSKRWQETCTTYYTERECLMLTDSDGNARCQWEDLIEGYDCSLLWPTTTTTTEAPGCCRGYSFKAQSKCEILDDQTGCERKGCEWVLTEDFSVCILTTTTTTTTTTTPTPGCCKGDSMKSNEKCNAIEDQDKCSKRAQCHFIEHGAVDTDCAFPMTEAPEEPGCCYGNPDAAYSKKWMESCTEFYTERDCLLLTNSEGDSRCHWEAITDGMYDCSQLWPTTTTTTEDPGCCRGHSYKAQAKCFGLEDQKGCERKDCEWVLTDNPEDCVMTTTTTTTTTTTEAPGCCMADSAKRQDMCDKKESKSKCDRSSSCHWIETDDPEDCMVEETTTSEPGCCYGNPEAAYSKRWMESCTAFYTERDCLMLTDSDGAYRCHWEELGEGYDCSQLWPTTTTTTVAAGCCKGSSYKAQDKCMRLEDQVGCERKQCEWVVTDDPNDCVITTTSTTSTSAIIGCCYNGESEKKNEKCRQFDEDRTRCDKNADCTFNEGEDADCEYTATTTTSEPWMGAKPEGARRKKAKSSSRHQEAMMFGDGQSVIAETMQYTVSLSTVLLLAVAAFAAHQIYRWCSARNSGFTKMNKSQTTSNGQRYYQSV